MSYRNYLFVVNKRKFNKIKKLNAQELWDAIGKEPDEWDIDDETGVVSPPYWRDLMEGIGGEEVSELGDAVFYKGCPIKVYDYLKKAFKVKEVHEWYNEDTEFMIAKPELLDGIIKVYIKRVEDNYTQLLKEDSEEPKDDFGYPLKPQLERLQNEIQSQLRWLKFVNDSDSKWCLATSWMYGHELFNIIHIKKIFDPKKEILIWAGA